MTFNGVTSNIIQFGGSSSIYRSKVITKKRMEGKNTPLTFGQLVQTNFWTVWEKIIVNDHIPLAEAILHDSTNKRIGSPRVHTVILCIIWIFT